MADSPTRHDQDKLDERVTELYENHLPHIYERLALRDLKLKFIGGGIAVLIVEGAARWFV